MNMLRLWTDHVVWTRQVIVSSLAGLPDVPTALERLMRNQDELGAAFGSPSIGSLLREHIRIAVELVKAAAASNDFETIRQDALWHRNASEIARTLAALNHHWPERELRSMMFEHLALTKQEAVARIQGDWAKDVQTFDAILTQALKMAAMFGQR